MEFDRIIEGWRRGQTWSNAFLLSTSFVWRADVGVAALEGVQEDIEQPFEKVQALLHHLPGETLDRGANWRVRPASLFGVPLGALAGRLPPSVVIGLLQDLLSMPAVLLGETLKYPQHLRVGFDGELKLQTSAYISNGDGFMEQVGMPDRCQLLDAPENWRSKEQSREMGVWGAAVFLHYALTKRFLFPGDLLDQLRDAQAFRCVTAPSLSLPIDALIKRCVAPASSRPSLTAFFEGVMGEIGPRPSSSERRGCIRSLCDEEWQKYRALAVELEQSPRP